MTERNDLSAGDGFYDPGAIAVDREWTPKMQAKMDAAFAPDSNALTPEAPKLAVVERKGVLGRLVSVVKSLSPLGAIADNDKHMDAARDPSS